MVIRLLAALPTVYCEYFGLCARYGIKDPIIVKDAHQTLCLGFILY